MPLIRKQLKPSDVYPDTIRYNEGTDTVQSLIDGVWTDNPAADPRTQTTLPPRITSNSRCDAAASVSDALKGQIDQTILAIDNAATAFTIAGIILSLLSFGVFAIFISIALTIADAMIGIGGTALAAALTPTVYEQFTCILYCHMTGEGRLQPEGLEGIQVDVTDQIGGVAATVLNSMLALAGEGGINNLASLGTSTGDCSGCDECGCAQGCTTDPFVFQWDDPAWIISGAPSRYSAGTPIGSFDSFNMATATSVLTLDTPKCIVDVSLSCNNGCPPGLGATLQMFIDGVSQGTQSPANVGGCGGVSCSWVFPDGIQGTNISFSQVGSPCDGGYDDLLICATIYRCIDP
jgi:hypothetical protein